MTTDNIGRWLLVGLAVLGLALAVPLVSAHGDGTNATDAPTDDGDAAAWAAWMDARMTDHVGPDAAEWMASHTGVAGDETPRGPADGDHAHGPDGEYTHGPDGDRARGPHGGSGNGGAYGHGHGC